MSCLVDSGDQGEAQLSNTEQKPRAESTASVDLIDDLYEEVHSDLIRFLAFKVRNAADSEELAQEIYLRLLKSDQVGFLRNPRAYLFRIAGNLLVDRGRIKSRRIRTVQWAPETMARSDDAADALDQLLSREKVSLVAAAVRELPKRCRQALVLHKREGWTYEMIATELGVSRSMVKKYLQRALLACTNALDDGSRTESGPQAIGEGG